MMELGLLPLEYIARKIIWKWWLNVLGIAKERYPKKCLMAQYQAA